MRFVIELCDTPSVDGFCRVVKGIITESRKLTCNATARAILTYSMVQSPS